MKVLHINCNYATTKLHSEMIEHFDNSIENKVFVPVYNKTLENRDDKVIIKKCFNKNDRFLFFYKQRKIYKNILIEEDIKSFDIIHAYTLFTDGYCAMKLSKEYNIPYVVAIRNTDLNYFFKYRVFLRKKGIEILKNASKIFFLSSTYKKQLVDNYVPIELKQEIISKSVIIPNGINDFWLTNLANASEKRKDDLNKRINITSVGNIDKNKNMLLVLKAIKLLEERGIKVDYRVVGKIRDKKYFEILSSYKSFKYLGTMIKEELIHLFRSADIFILPSHAESFGLVYAEAMSQGVPVIYTRGQGFDGQFEEGVVGYCVDSNNVEEVINRINDIIGNYESISANCLRNVVKFNWKSICDIYVKIYQKII